MKQFNQHQIIHSFNKAAKHYEDAAIVQRMIGEQLIEQLEIIKINPCSIIDLGCATGYLTEQVAQCYPQAQILGIDIAEQMIIQAKQRETRKLQFACHMAEALPLESDSVDLIISNLMLQWCNELDPILMQCLRVLKPNGLLLFTSLGPNTLLELKASWQVIDDYPHVHDFIDMHTIGDILLQQGWYDPVMHRQDMTVSYANVLDLMHSIKAIGAQNIHAQRFRGLQGKHIIQQLQDIYQSRYAQPDEKLPVTYEVIYGHAWKPEQAKQYSQADGSTVIPISSIKKFD